MKHLKIKTKNNKVYKYATFEELATALVDLSPNIKMAYFRGDLFWHKLLSKEDVEEFNLKEVDCWGCKHALFDAVTFYEYGEESSKGECGENYEVKPTCMMGLRTGTHIRCRHYKDHTEKK